MDDTERQRIRQMLTSPRFAVCRELFESASAYLLARHTGNGIAEAELRLTQAVSAYEKVEKGVE
jgi:hypothetical protein